MIKGMKKKRKSRIGCLFWIALILLAVVVFVFNRSRIEGLFNAAGIKNLVTMSSPVKPTVTRLPQSPPETAKPLPKPAPVVPSTPRDPTGNAPSSTGGASVAPPAVQATPKPDLSRRSFQSTLYYVRVQGNGTPSLQTVTRDIPSADSPLTDTMRSLLSRLSSAELNSGLMTLIPDGTELLNVTVKDGTAYLDFNDRLRFNSFGVDGFKAELQQLIFTATQFSTVKRVQILIGGQVHRYLGPEGIAIDSPLTRASFQNG